MSDYERVVFNSKFTASHSGSLSLGEDIPTVLYPPVDIGSGRCDGWDERDANILAVGRFAAHGHPKRQLELVRVFRELLESGLEGWKLVLVGSVASDPVSRDYLERVREAARELPVELHIDSERAEVLRHYERSRIFWHAAGMNVDETSAPEKVEHFGISTVEAMGRGLIPIVIDRGGQREIVEHGIDGYRWSDADELKARTREVIARGSENDAWSWRAMQSARRFSRERFARQVEALVSGELVSRES